MKTVIIFSLLLASSSLFAQNVGVNGDGSSPDASAILDVKATDKGVLVPRVDIIDLTTAAPVTTPVTSLLVYNTNTTTGPGFFYWNDTIWATVGGAKEINDLSDGKTDYGGEESVYLGLNAGDSATAGGFWDGKYNVVVGVDAFKTTTGGHESVAIGYKALELGTTSTRNTAVGYLALQNNSGTGNTAIGGQSMNNSLTSSENTAIGNFSLNSITSGLDNVSVGFTSGQDLITGSHNIFLGVKSGLNLTGGNYNIAIGENSALANATGNNQLNIGNLIYADSLYKSNGRVGIGFGNNAPNSTLSVNGSISTSYNSGGTIFLDDTHYTYNCNMPGQVIRLPTAIGITGRVYIIKFTAAGSSSVLTTGGQTIDGVANYVLSAKWKYVKVQSDGANWIIIGQN